MRPFTFMIAGSFAAFATATTTACAADNCLRAIRASAFPTRPGTADCSSYFITTVTPATYTSTVMPGTTTVTVFNNKERRAPVAAPEPTLEARQVTVVPSKIPAYASPCSGSVRYSSACSCIGVTHTTTTAPTPTTVVTADATSTIVDTYPYIDFTGWISDSSCSSGATESGSFVAGECVILPNELSIEDGALNPGNICADPSTCTLYFYGSGFDGCSPDNLATDSNPGGGCIYTGDYLYGQLLCPDC